MGDTSRSRPESQTKKELEGSKVGGLPGQCGRFLVVVPSRSKTHKRQGDGHEDDNQEGRRTGEQSPLGPVSEPIIESIVLEGPTKTEMAPLRRVSVGGGWG